MVEQSPIALYVTSSWRLHPTTTVGHRHDPARPRVVVGQAFLRLGTVGWVGVVSPGDKDSRHVKDKPVPQ